MTMQRWDPFSELKRLEDRVGQFWHRMPFNESIEEWSVPLDVREQDGKVIIEASVPGMKAEEIDVSIEDGTLTIKGETVSEKEEKKEGYLLKERRQGSFYRSVRLPESVDATQASSSYSDGVLTVSMPKQPEKQPTKIKVDVS